MSGVVYARSELWMELNFNIEVVETSSSERMLKKSRYYFIRRKGLYIKISSYLISKGKRDWGGKWRYIHSEKVVDEVKF